MQNVAMVGPKGNSGLSHAGKYYKPAKDGTITVPGFAVEVAKSHGFKVADDQLALSSADKKEPLGPKLVDLGDGKFDVLNDQGQKVNERPLAKADADKTLAELQK